MNLTTLKSYRLNAVALLIALLVIQTARAQVNPTTEVNFEPYKNIFDVKLKHTAGVKQKSSFIKYQKIKFNNYDTLSVETYDKAGKQTSYISFNSNTGKREKTTLISYQKKGNIVEELHEDNDIRDPNKRVVDSIFNKIGKDSIVRTVSTYRKNPTVYKYEYLFGYDKSGQLINFKYIINARLINYTNYYYTGGRLTKQEYFRNPQLKTMWEETTYAYSADGLLIKKDLNDIRNGVITLLGYNEYHYTNNALSDEKYWEIAVDKTPTTVKYEYNADSTLSKLFIQKDTLYKTIQYQYQDKKIAKVHIETNATSGLSREFTTLVYFGNQKKFPIIYDAQYIYDKKGNLIEWRSLLNGELQNAYGYDLQYY